jgi:hypothetical protein
MHRGSEVLVVAALGLERAHRLLCSQIDVVERHATPAPGPAVEEQVPEHFRESRSLILDGFGIQLALLALSGLAFQLAFPAATQWVRVLIAGSITGMFLVSNYWVMALMPRADWARFFSQTLEASKRRRESEGSRRTPWLRRWYHLSWSKGSA